jgi:hypothetical protein
MDDLETGSDAKAPDAKARESLRKMLGHAMRGELEDLASLAKAAGDENHRLALGMCVVAARYIAFDVCTGMPAAVDLRSMARIIAEAETLAEFREAGGYVTFAVSESTVFGYLSRIAVGLEPDAKAFHPVDASTLPLFFTAAMLEVFHPRDRQWEEYLDQIWAAFSTAERVPLPVLPALMLRARGRARA